MEKAKLVVTKSKKGALIGTLVFEGGKQLNIPKFQVDEGMNQKECEVWRDNTGHAVKIVIEGQELRKVESSPGAPPHRGEGQSSYGRGPAPYGGQRGGPQRPQESAGSSISRATAPYNFIPLNDEVVPAEFASREDFPSLARYRDRDGYLTGHIDLTITTRTPLFIRGTSADPKKKSKDNPDFFSPGGICKIPGSSLRGMTRALVEIISWGKFSNFDDRRLYYRSVGDTSKLGLEYRKKMVDEKDDYFPRVKAGIMRKTSQGYQIFPSKIICKTQFYRVNFDKDSRKIADTNIQLPPFTFRKIFFEPVEPKTHFHHYGKLKLKYAKVTKISETSQPGFVEGYLVSTGDFGNKKHMHWIINMPEDRPLFKVNFDDPVVYNYKHDENRSDEDGVDVLKKLDEVQEVPCFFLLDEGGQRVTAFGHTGMFRIPYDQTTKDLVGEIHGEEKIIDLPEAIFGKKGQFASRVFFEDALLKEGQTDIFLPLKTLKILSTPKPTTFQHYLEQKTNNKSQLNHWDSKGGRIRGYKFYWHRNTQESSHPEHWAEKENRKIPSNQHTNIKAVKSGVSFIGRICFENLSPVELGALLFALQLPENHYHKLGMGKPLGLGSVEIQSQLFVSDREKRYKKLFVNQGWELAEEQKDSLPFIAAFEQYVLKELRRINPSQFSHAKSLWDINRMKQLKTMLDWKNTEKRDWLMRTKYLTLQEFKYRNILPMPLEVST